MTHRFWKCGLLLLPWVVEGCGAKDLGQGVVGGEQLEPDDDGLAIGDCRGDEDCPTEDACFPRTCLDRECVELEPVRCDDGDPCTVDTCSPQNAACTFEPLTPDIDGDGHRQPLPGFVAGTPQACGDDCDDRSAEAFPGGREVCDGVDNDCNGITDDGYVFTREGGGPMVVADAPQGVESGGLVHTGERYVALVTTNREHYQAQLLGLGSGGMPTFTTDVVLSNNDTFGGSLTWSGQALAVAWEDRRDGDYEIYFNRFDPMGRKLDPDLRLSRAPGFSLDPTLLFTGTEYLVAWSDERNGSGDFRVFGQRVSLLGQPLGTNVNLTPDSVNARSAVLTPGATELGLTFSGASPDGELVAFRVMTYDFSALGPIVQVSAPNASGGGAVYAQGRYVLSWSEYVPGAGPGGSIWGAVLDRDGSPLVPAKPLTAPDGFARTHSVLSLGDRLLIAWANDRGESYDIFLQLFSVDLEPLSTPLQVTNSGLDELGPRLRFGANGQVALLYTERTNDRGPRVMLETLTCR